MSDYYKQDLKTRLAASTGVLAVLGLLLAFFFRLFLSFCEWVSLIILLGVYMLPGFGKESVLPAMLGGGYILDALAKHGISIQVTLPAAGYPLRMAVLGILAVDMVLAVLISYNFDLLLQVPLLGQVLDFFTRKTTHLLEIKPWIKGLAGTGLFLFMYIPFMGSSAINTSIIGRILSMHPKILMPIVFSGSILATLTLGLSIEALIALWLINPWIVVLAAVLAAAAVILGRFLWKRHAQGKKEG
ncbi:MAG TPA: small multi-drug export protein [Methanocorpusculum sp.]|nr:small multi-drug export protein [Methanocorpusculum sp.]